MMKQILLVGLGGGIGSILRYLTSELMGRYFSNPFPLATFAVNISGCLLIGLLIGILGTGLQINQNLRLLFITGFCGGFTTFSAFAAENLSLLQNNIHWTAILYIGLSILSGLLAVWLGITMGRHV